MFSYQTLWFCALALGLFHGAWGERGCPPAEEIEPCTCEEFVYVDLICQNIRRSDQLEQVFKNAERYHFQKFTLKDSSLQYIPHSIFNNVEIKVMSLETVSFVETFDEIPHNPGLQKVLIDKVRVGRGWDWSRLSLFTELQDLTIVYVPIKRLSTEFKPNVSKNIKVLRLSWCGLKKLRDDEFSEFTELEKFTATHDELSVISRNMFARPSKLREISFEYNKISSIPDDMFTDMPDLYFVSFGSNSLSLLAENVFKPIISQVKYMRFQDNPFRCDCRIQWLTFHKEDIQYLYGKCATPKNLYNKQLVDLKPEDFRC